MDTLHRLARARYNGGSNESRKMAHNLFNEIDIDRDGTITVNEFVSYLRENGDEEGLIGNERFFRSLDKDKNGSLNFWEVLTIYYALFESGRPYCDSCKTFIPDVYFSCVECFDNGSPSFDLCLDCYATFNMDHKHNDVPCDFLDNFALLHRVREAKSTQDSCIKVNFDESELEIHKAEEEEVEEEAVLDINEEEVKEEEASEKKVEVEQVKE